MTTTSTPMKIRNTRVSEYPSAQAWLNEDRVTSMKVAQP